MPQKKRPSRQDIIRAQQRSTFVGRVEHLETFEQNLVHLNRTDDGFSYPNEFLFNVWGQGGVGKTTLLRRFEDIAKRQGGVTARIDEAIASVPEVTAAFVRQLTEQGQAFSKFFGSTGFNMRNRIRVSKFEAFAHSVGQNVRYKHYNHYELPHNEDY